MLTCGESPQSSGDLHEPNLLKIPHTGEHTSLRVEKINFFVLCAYREQVAALGSSALGGSALGDIIVVYEYCIICSIDTVLFIIKRLALPKIINNNILDEISTPCTSIRLRIRRALRKL